MSHTGKKPLSNDLLLPGRSWSQDEELHLYDATIQGNTAEEISIQHSRTMGAIRARQVRLGLRKKTSGPLTEPPPPFRPFANPLTETTPPFRPFSKKKPQANQRFQEQIKENNLSPSTPNHSDISKVPVSELAKKPKVLQKITSPVSEAQVRQYTKIPYSYENPNDDELTRAIYPHDDPVALLWLALKSDIEKLNAKHKDLYSNERDHAILLSRLSPNHEIYPRNTLQELGDQFGVSRERIRQLETKGIRKLKWRTRFLNSKLHHVLGIIFSRHSLESPREKLTWLATQMIDDQCETLFQSFILDVFFIQTHCPDIKTSDVISAVKIANRKKRGNEKRETKEEARKERVKLARRKADFFVLQILKKSRYGGDYASDSVDMSEFVPLRSCNGNLVAYSRMLERFVSVESHGEARLVKALDRCSIVDAFAEQAIKIPYEIDNSMKSYIPDCVIQTVEGLVYGIEIKARIQLADRVVQTKARAAATFLGQRGIGYCLVDSNGCSAEELLTLEVDEALKSFLRGQLRKAGVVRLRDLYRYFVDQPRFELIDQIQCLVLKHNLDYRTWLTPSPTNRMGYKFDFELRLAS